MLHMVVRLLNLQSSNSGQLNLNQNHIQTKKKMVKMDLEMVMTRLKTV